MLSLSFSFPPPLVSYTLRAQSPPPFFPPPLLPPSHAHTLLLPSLPSTHIFKLVIANLSNLLALELPPEADAGLAIFVCVHLGVIYTISGGNCTICWNGSLALPLLHRSDAEQDPGFNEARIARCCLRVNETALKWRWHSVWLSPTGVVFDKYTT